MEGSRSSDPETSLSGDVSAPFPRRIFVADGDLDGLRIIEKSPRIDKALVF